MICFLDRDGVINFDSGYVGTLDRFQLIKEIIPILEFLKLKKYRFVIVTNQSGINRGYFKYSEFLELSFYIINLFKKYSIPLEINYCPSLPEENSIFRKPNVGMFLKYKITENDIMIGDKDTDMIAAKKAGIKKRFLINENPQGPYTNQFNNHNSLYKYLLESTF